MLSQRIIKYIQSLSHKKLRDEHGQFVAETPKVIAEFLTTEILTAKYYVLIKHGFLKMKIC